MASSLLAARGLMVQTVSMEPPVRERGTEVMGTTVARETWATPWSCTLMDLTMAGPSAVRVVKVGKGGEVVTAHLERTLAAATAATVVTAVLEETRR